MLVGCLDADEEKYPPPAGTAAARTVLASIRQTEIQSTMDEFVANSESTLE